MTVLPRRRLLRAPGPGPARMAALHTVTVDVSGDLVGDSYGEMRMAMVRQ